MQDWTNSLNISILLSVINWHLKFKKTFKHLIINISKYNLLNSKVIYSKFLDCIKA